jgi:hypothetical protein
LAGKKLVALSGFVVEDETMYACRFYSVAVVALFAGCRVLLSALPAVAGDDGVPKVAVEAASVLEPQASSTGGLPPLNTLTGAKTTPGNRPAFPPAMFAALEDLSKKPIADGQPAKIAPGQSTSKPAATGVEPGKTNRVATPPRVQLQHKAAPERQAGFRPWRPSSPAAKIEALRERLQHAPAFLHRRGFHRPG